MTERSYVIKKKQLFFLKENISSEILADKFSKDFKNENLILQHTGAGEYKIKLNEMEVSMLLDELTLLFTSKGLMENDEPNSFGLFVEELIDVFSRWIDD